MTALTLFLLVGLLVATFGLILAQSYIGKLGTEIKLGRFIFEQLILEPVVFVFRWVPGGWGIFARLLLYKLLLGHMGKKVMFGYGVKVTYPESVFIDDYSGVNDNCLIEGGGKITIGKWVRLAPGVAILTMNHAVDNLDVPIKRQGLVKKPVTIEDNVWVGMNSIILPGVTIHSGAVIGAGSVVTKDVHANTIVGGVPARPIRTRGVQAG